MSNETERRTTFRERVMLGGLVATGSNDSKVGCVVRNLSPHGAHIEFTQAASIPERIQLAITKSGRSYWARIVWWGANRVGVAFDASPPLQTVAPDIEERLRIAEKKARILKRRVRELTGEG